MTAELQPERRTSGQVDGTVTKSVKVLAAARGLEPVEARIAEVLGVDRTTIIRRFRNGGWRATEVARLADYFQVRVGDLYEGHLVLTVTDRYRSGAAGVTGVTGRRRGDTGSRGRLHPVRDCGGEESIYQPPLLAVVG